MSNWETRGLTEAFYKNLEKDQISTRARIVKMCLMHFTNAKGEKAYPSIERLCSMTALSKRSVRYALRELEKKQHLETHYAAGQVNSYTIISKDNNQDPGRISRGNIDHCKISVSTTAKSKQNPGKNCPRSVNDQVKIDQLKDKGNKARIAGASTPTVSKPLPSTNPPLLKQNLRATENTAVDKLASRCQQLNGWPEKYLPDGDYLKRVEQALSQFGYEECVCAVDGYHRWAKRIKSSNLDFWHAFPPLQLNNQKITNRLDVGRVRSFIREGRGSQPLIAPPLDRPKAPIEDDWDRRRLDSIWRSAHNDALGEARKQNMKPEEASRYAKKQADQEIRNEINSKPSGPEYAKKQLRKLSEAHAQSRS